MKVDGGIAADLADAGRTAKDTESAGYDGAWVPEASHDPFLACVLGAEHTQRLEIGTSIAVAFARSPMTVAHSAHDLQRFSSGRFTLGLGSQIKPHIEQRFSMPWSKPAARMREFVCALHAIWDCWNNDVPLDFVGEFYRHKLMTPFFNPGPNAAGPPKVFLAGVGELMTEVAGEVADGFICHRFTTERYLREVTIPALERGRAKVGKALDGFEIALPSYVVSGFTEEEIDTATAKAREGLAFYASTPSYKRVLELHGWEGVYEELHALSKGGRWGEMGSLIDDEMLHALAVVGTPDAVGPELLRRYGSVVSRVSFNTVDTSDVERWRPLMVALQAG